MQPESQQTETTEPMVSQILLAGNPESWSKDLYNKLLTAPIGATINMFIECGGGAVSEFMAYMHLILIRKINVQIVVLSDCSSAALLLFAVAKNRYVLPTSELLFHLTTVKIPGHKSHAEIKSCAANFARLEEAYDKLLTESLNIPLEDIQQWKAAHRQFSGTEMVAMGLATLYEGQPMMIEEEDKK